MHEVPFCFDFHVNNTTLECLPCPRSSGQWPMRQLSASLPELIAKQVAFPPDSYSKQELSVRTLWLDTKMMVSPTKLRVHESFSLPEYIAKQFLCQPDSYSKQEPNVRTCGLVQG